jgi:hypothetical protein
MIRDYHFLLKKREIMAINKVEVGDFQIYINLLLRAILIASAREFTSSLV